jgi:hypothetical protein
MNSSTMMTGTLPIPYEANTFPRKVERRVPVGTVNEVALKGVEARDCRPLPGIEYASGVDKKVAPFLEHSATRGLNLDNPFTGFFFPVAANNLVAAADILTQSVLIDEIGKIFTNLG